MDEKRHDHSGQPNDAPDAGEPAPPARKRRPAEPAVPDSAALAGMGLQFLVVILLCLFAGRWLDARLGTTPILTVLGVLLGAGVSMWSMYRRVFPVDK